MKEATFWSELARKLRQFGRKLWRGLKTATKRLHLAIKKFTRESMRHFTKWIDPKLEKYRIHPREQIDLTVPETRTKVRSVAKSQQRLAQAAKIDTNTPFNTAAPSLEPPSTASAIPQTRAELFATIQDAPLSILNNHDRKMMSTLLDLPNIPASEIMLPEKRIVYVNHDEVLGPLTLDRLYHSGLSHFPVINTAKQVIGIINTTHLNNLEIRDSSRADAILDPGVYYVREDYNLEEVLAAFVRTNTQLFLVVDHFGKTVGLITFKDFVKYLFGDYSQDHFDRDDDRLAVSKRKINQVS